MYENDKSEQAHESRRPRSGRDGSVQAVAATARDAREARRSGHAGVRPRRAPGPRPVRPSAVTVSVRPAQGERPSWRPEPGSRALQGRERTLVRRPAALSVREGSPARRLLGGIVVAALAALVVIGWGLLLTVTGPASPAAVQGAVEQGAVEQGAAERSASRQGAVIVTVGADEPTVWEVARRVEPDARGARLSAVAERIATANSLTSVELQPGRLLLIPAG
jgi:hypothetical protein